jgi:hypothetical protein
MRIAVIACGSTSLSRSAAGRMNSSLFFSEPLAIAAMIGSSRAGVKFVTYEGVTAASSMTTPAALLPAFAAAAPTSSSEAAAARAISAMSSNSATRPVGMRNLSLTASAARRTTASAG